MNRRYGYWIGLLIVLVGVCWPVIRVAAQDGVYPDYTDVYVNDFAGVMDAAAETEIRAMLEGLYTDYGIEAAVLTVDSYREYGVRNETIEVFATGVFNAWGVGDATRNDGVLLVVAIKEREVRIEIGAGYDGAMDARMQSVLVENILPAFRAGDYSRGIINGIRQIIFVLVGETDLAGSSAASSASVSSAAADAGDNGIGVNPYAVGGVGAGVLGAGGIAGRRYLRYRQRQCAACGAIMQRLDEVADDVHLSSGEKAEELLASIDYDVWLCPRCGRHDIRGYPNLLSGYRHCPNCHYRTLQVSSHTSISPTTSHSGEKVVEQFCRHCKYSDRQVVVLPMIQRSDSGFSSSSGSSHRSSSRSSSRSSFGGGKSKGGGASGKW